MIKASLRYPDRNGGKEILRRRLAAMRATARIRPNEYSPRAIRIVYENLVARPGSSAVA